MPSAEACTVRAQKAPGSCGNVSGLGSAGVGV